MIVHPLLRLLLRKSSRVHRLDELSRFSSHLKPSVLSLPNLRCPLLQLPRCDHPLSSHLKRVRFKLAELRWSDDPRCKPQTIYSCMETVPFGMLANCLQLVLGSCSRSRNHSQSLPDPLTKRSKMWIGRHCRMKPSTRKIFLFLSLFFDKMDNVQNHHTWLS